MPETGMELGEILRGADLTEGTRLSDTPVIINGLVYDSRRVRPGDLFFAVPGFKTDGTAFIPAAVSAGAAAVICQKLVHGIGIPAIQVADIRLAMALAASNFYHRPSESLNLTGVTGTNGKTTTTYLIDSILRASGISTGLIGGVQNRIGTSLTPSARTTPEAIDTQRLLAEMVHAGVSAATIEVSSHGIELSRVAFLDFDVAVFTNLTHDHLDLHADMETYFQTKQRLFRGLLDPRELSASSKPTPRPVVNIEDEFGNRLAQGLNNVITFGLTPIADIHADGIEVRKWGSAFNLSVPGGEARVELQIPGRYNVMNALAAAGAAFVMGIGVADIASGLAGFRGVPGRFELVNEHPFRVIIDYAHNQDGLAQALGTARELASGRLITVFGCPGERDEEKRPLMGEIAGRLSDLAILTTDDCYQESPGQIMDATEAGLVRSGGEFRRYADRREAIATALKAAKPDDTVLIAGKGHETVQHLAEGPVPFSDRQVVLDLLSEQ